MSMMGMAFLSRLPSGYQIWCKCKGTNEGADGHPKWGLILANSPDGSQLLSLGTHASSKADKVLTYRVASTRANRRRKSPVTSTRARGECVQQRRQCRIRLAANDMVRGKQQVLEAESENGPSGSVNAKLASRLIARTAQPPSVTAPPSLWPLNWIRAGTSERRGQVVFQGRSTSRRFGPSVGQNMRLCTCSPGMRFGSKTSNL